MIVSFLVTPTKACINAFENKLVMNKQNYSNEKESN
ncbi:hypothetical protein DFQ12_3909 [Sphingobacterium detergens]|uniref:Uncharacterized protein n=1 Tax=Sphingobacterium detergens TaxID=1145106 RepID=A0A420AQL6_SPHD1|nr:hypothetical protein DFQ12_3909 [Sphingobacterium detergens]